MWLLHHTTLLLLLLVSKTLLLFIPPHHHLNMSSLYSAPPSLSLSLPALLCLSFSFSSSHQAPFSHLFCLLLLHCPILRGELLTRGVFTLPHASRDTQGAKWNELMCYIQSHIASGKIGIASTTPAWTKENGTPICKLSLQCKSLTASETYFFVFYSISQPTSQPTNKTTSQPTQSLCHLWKQITGIVQCYLVG